MGTAGTASYPKLFDMWFVLLYHVSSLHSNPYHRFRFGTYSRCDLYSRQLWMGARVQWRAAGVDCGSDTTTAVRYYLEQKGGSNVAYHGYLSTTLPTKILGTIQYRWRGTSERRIGGLLRLPLTLPRLRLSPSPLHRLLPDVPRRQHLLLQRSTAAAGCT